MEVVRLVTAESNLTNLSRLTLSMSNTRLCCWLKTRSVFAEHDDVTVTSTFWSQNVICSFSGGPSGHSCSIWWNCFWWRCSRDIGGDENVIGRRYGGSRHSCGRRRGVKHLYVFLFMCGSWRFDDGETAFRCSASSGHTLLTARVSIWNVFVCVNHLFSARWLNVSECHTCMVTRSP